MDIVKQEFELIDQEVPVKKLDMDSYVYSSVLQNAMYKHIEKCARTCYKSEDKITDDSAKPFVQRMIDSEHYAMLEHGTVYLHFSYTSPVDDSNYIQMVEKEVFYKGNPFSRVNVVRTKSYLTDVYVTTNLRVIVENNRQDDLLYVCAQSENHAKRHTVKFTACIHFYKDTTRHRVFSWAIESTRFCNYIKNKFGHSVTFVQPCWLKPEDQEEFENDCKAMESIYFKWIEKGYHQQEAAYFLCQGTKAEVIMTGFEDDFKHFFDLRADGTTGKPHPCVEELAKPLKENFIKLGWLK